MGCDIHLHIEVKFKGKWEHYGAPSIDRSYQLFEKMAGVRGELENAIVAPKGIPNNCTVLTLADYEHWGVDAHTASWLNESEIQKLADWVETLPGRKTLEYGIMKTWLFGSSFVYNGKPGAAEFEAVRFVFWFDN